MVGNMQEINVQVAVRVRPLLQKEILSGEAGCVRVAASSNQISVGRDHCFTFDHVFNQKASQMDIYSRCIDPLVKSFLEGYNATVFAYGQTGSGKTHTIGGGSVLPEDSECMGMIARAVLQIFASIQTDSSREYSLKVSYFEIYKEELRDLMDYDRDKTLCIREDDKGSIIVVGAAEVVCEGVEDVMTVLRRGSTCRQTSATLINERSSRSHAVFTITLGQTWSDDDGGGGVKVRRRSLEDMKEEEDLEHYMGAKFHFVDLAGSERAHKTGNVGERFKESVHINTGLLALGNVISALGDVKRKATHIPYRDSKITRILKDSLGGNARTLMICCVSPASCNMDETLNSLKYANRARNIRNKPVINRDPHMVRFEEMQGEIKALRAELHRQRTQSSMSSSRATTAMREESVGEEQNNTAKQLQKQLTRVQIECVHYQTLLGEMIGQLIDLRDRERLSESQVIRLTEWSDLLEEIKNSVPAALDSSVLENQTIKRLEKELSECKGYLESDELIFKDKVLELEDLEGRFKNVCAENVKLLKRIEELELSHAHTESLLIAKQMELDQLSNKIKDQQTTAATATTAGTAAGSAAVTAVGVGGARRAVSVPSDVLRNRAATSRHTEGSQDQISARAVRNIHTSPAVITVDRVLNSFRARSHLLASMIEDEDDVIVKSFNDDDDDDVDDEAVVEGMGNECGDGQFNRSQMYRGTYRVTKSVMNRPQISPNVCQSTPTLSPSHGVTPTPQGRVFSRPNLTHRLSRQQGPQVLKIEGEVTDTRLNKAEQNVRRSTAQLNDLTLKIKMKEQLIKDLVRQNNESERRNELSENKIKQLEMEKAEAQDQFITLQQATKNLKQQERIRNDQLQADYRKRAEIAVANIQQLKKKQREAEVTAKQAEIDKQIQSLSAEVEGLKKQEIESLRENARLERELEEERRRVYHLQSNKESDTYRAKVKTSAVSKNQNNNSSLSNKYSSTSVEEKARWLDEEIEALLEQKQATERLEKELEARGEMLERKERMLEEKSELMMRKLRSSQTVQQDLVALSSRLTNVDELIEEKEREISATPRESQGRARQELDRLMEGRGRLNDKYTQLHERLGEGGEIMSALEERQLIEMEEALEALDAAIQYKNESIEHQSQLIRSSIISPRVNNNNNDGSSSSVAQLEMTSRFRSLSAVEARSLLKRYFDKTVELRNDQRQRDKVTAQLEMRVNEQMQCIRELETSLQVTSAECDRKLIKQKREYEHQIELLNKHIDQSDLYTKPDTRVQELEKELYYYKKTSRDLRKRVKEMTSPVTIAGDRSDSIVNGLSESEDSHTDRPNSKNGVKNGEGPGYPPIKQNTFITETAPKNDPPTPRPDPGAPGEPQSRQIDKNRTHRVHSRDGASKQNRETRNNSGDVATCGRNENDLNNQPDEFGLLVTALNPHMQQQQQRNNSQQQEQQRNNNNQQQKTTEQRKPSGEGNNQRTGTSRQNTDTNRPHRSVGAEHRRTVTGQQRTETSHRPTSDSISSHIRVVEGGNVDGEGERRGEVRTKQSNGVTRKDLHSTLVDSLEDER